MKYFWKNLVIEMPASFNGQILDVILTEEYYEWIPLLTEENGKIEITIGRMV